MRAVSAPRREQLAPIPMPHLLLIDDDDLFRESLGLNLVDEGYEVTSFGNGQDALAYLNRSGRRRDPIGLADAQPHRDRRVAANARRRYQHPGNLSDCALR